MTEFKRSKKNFRKYVGPRCRNIVNVITTGHRKRIGKCQECGDTERLEAAHITGNSRMLIIESILEEFPNGDNGDLLVNLESFEEKFKAKHMPIEGVIRVLCEDCHDNYDKKVSEPTSGPAPGKLP